MRALLFALLFAVSGCQTSWERYYKPTGIGAIVNVLPTATVQVREVEGERYNNYINDQSKRQLHNNKAVEEWSRNEYYDEMTKLLTTLRISKSAPAALVIGASEFGYLGKINVFEYERSGLEDLAKRKGADIVVVCKVYLGQRQGVGYLPMVTNNYSTGSTQVYGSGGYATGNYQSAGTSTTYMPYAYSNDDWSVIAFFVRYTKPTDKFPEKFR